MKNLVLLLLTVFAGLSRVEAQNDFLLHFSNQTGGYCSVQMNIAPPGREKIERVWIFSNSLKEDSIVLESGATYPVIIRMLGIDNNHSKTYLYTIPADASEDTMALLPDVSVRAGYEVKEVIYDEQESLSEGATANDYLPAEDPVLEATPPDSLIGASIDSAWVPAKAKKPSLVPLFGKKPWEIASWDGFSPAKQDSFLRADGECILTVINQTSDIFKFRVGHLFWEKQNSLLQDQSGIMYIDADEHHELHRYIWKNGTLHGSEREDMYSFYIPRGVVRHSITFGGLQTGRVVNQSGEAIRFSTPVMVKSVQILDNSYRDDVQAYTGKQIFLVYFGPDFKRYRELEGSPNDDPADNEVHVEKVVNGREVMGIKRVDFVVTVTPEHLRTATETRYYEPRK